MLLKKNMCDKVLFEIVENIFVKLSLRLVEM